MIHAERKSKAFGSSVSVLQLGFLLENNGEIRKAWLLFGAALCALPRLKSEKAQPTYFPLKEWSGIDEI